jgi:hypothetical protein
MRLTRSLPLAALALLVGAALASTGCIQSDAKTTLLADGSGSSTDSVSIDIQKIKDLMEMAKAFGGNEPGMGGPEVPDMDIEKTMDAAFTEDSIRKQMKEVPGVELKNVKSEKKDGKRTVTTEIAFADFSSLGKVNGQSAVTLAKNDDGSWTLTYDALGGQGAMLSGGAQAGKEGGAEGMPAGMDMSAMMGMFEPYLGTLEMKRTVTLPGTILETNGTKADDGKTVSWKFTFKDLMTPPKDGKSAATMTVRFKGDGLTLKPFSFKPDPREAMKRFGAEGPKHEAGKAPEAPKGPDAPKNPEAPEGK